MDSSTNTKEESTLAQLLTTIGLPQWHDLILDWTGRFDGWRACYEASPTMQPDFTPLSMAIAALLEMAGATYTSDVALAEVLANLDFTYWRACRADNPREIWYPLQETFREFATRGPVSVWADTETAIPPGVIKYWLLGRQTFKDWRSEGTPQPATGSPPTIQ